MTDISMILDRIGRTLSIDVAPYLDGHYAGGHVTISGLMTIMAAQQFDGIVDRMLMEISDMRTLLEDGGKDPGNTRAENMKVSTLQIIHDRLSKDLIDLQSEIEVRDDDASKALNARIWMYFVEGANARMPELPDIGEKRQAAMARVAAERE